MPFNWQTMAGKRPAKKILLSPWVSTLMLEKLHVKVLVRLLVMNLFRLKKLFKLLTKNITFSKVLHFKSNITRKSDFSGFSSWRSCHQVSDFINYCCCCKRSQFSLIVCWSYFYNIRRNNIKSCQPS